MPSAHAPVGPPSARSRSPDAAPALPADVLLQRGEGGGSPGWREAPPRSGRPTPGPLSKFAPRTPAFALVNGPRRPHRTFVAIMGPMARDHYLPAALLGRFSLDSSPTARERWLYV